MLREQDPQERQPLLQTVHEAAGEWADALLLVSCPRVSVRACLRLN